MLFNLIENQISLTDLVAVPEAEAEANDNPVIAEAEQEAKRMRQADHIAESYRKRFWKKKK